MSKLGPWFTSRWDSECDNCGDLVMEGDSMRADGEGGWVCEMCGRDDLDE